MKPTGITRRIDELGRIVIPKEIRKSLNIKSGELLEIFLSDFDIISLKKYSLINKNDELLDKFVQSLSKKTNCNVFISDRDKIIFSNIKDTLYNKLSYEFENYKINSINNPLKLTKNYTLNFPYNILSIAPNGDLVGYLVFESLDNNINKYEELVKFAILFLEDYFEI